MPRDNSKALQLLNILEDPKGASARKKYLKLFDLDEINDQAVYELIEDLVVSATLLKDPAVEIRTDLAQQMLIMLKLGINKPRGGQQSTRYKKLRLRTLVCLGRGIKAELIEGGMNATQAHFEAAEDAAAEGAKHGVNYKADYLAREMDKAKE